MLEEDASDQQVFNTSTKDRTKSRPTCYTVYRLGTAEKRNVKLDSYPWEQTDFHDHHKSQFFAPYLYLPYQTISFLSARAMNGWQNLAFIHSVNIYIY